MKLRMLGIAAVLVGVLPAQAWAGQYHGVVIAKQPQRGTLVLAGSDGAGSTVHGGLAAAVGDQITVTGSRLHDGTIRLTKLQVLMHVRRTTIRGTIVSERANVTLVATGPSLILIHSKGRHLASARDEGQAGTIADFRVRFDNNDLDEAAPPVTVGQATNVQIEGVVVSTNPLVISAEGLPVTVTVPAGITLPVGLAAGQRVELAVQVGAGNTFTLASVGEVETNANGNLAEQQEVEVKGVIVSSSASQVVVNDGGATFTFTAPNGVTLPVLAAATPVEVKGFDQNGTLTVSRLRLEDNDDGNHGDSNNDNGALSGTPGGPAGSTTTAATTTTTTTSSGDGDHGKADNRGGGSNPSSKGDGDH